MSTILERVDLDRISAEARQMDARRVFLALVLGLLYLIGWTAGMIVKLTWLTVRWSFAAMKVGWQDAMADKGPRRQ